MENQYMELTTVDRQILESYKILLDGLGRYLGSGYELVLHSLENLDKSVIKIVNGHYTGRKEGAPITNLALKMLSELEKKQDCQAEPYFNKGRNGAMMRSCTIPITGEQGRIIGLLCMNFHMEVSVDELLKMFLPHPNAALPTAPASETFAEDIEDLILTSLKESREAVDRDPLVSAVNRNKEIILSLYQKGIFNLKDAVVRVAEELNVSKNTVYMHIRNFKKQ